MALAVFCAMRVNRYAEATNVRNNTRLRILQRSKSHGADFMSASGVERNGKLSASLDRSVSNGAAKDVGCISRQPAKSAIRATTTSCRPTKAKPDALWDKRKSRRQPRTTLFRPQDFKVAVDLSHCICPAGKRLYRNGRHHNLNGFEAVKFTGTKRDCEKCPRRVQCLRHPQRTQVRQVAISLRKVIFERALEHRSSA